MNDNSSPYSAHVDALIRASGSGLTMPTIELVKVVETNGGPTEQLIAALVPLGWNTESEHGGFNSEPNKEHLITAILNVLNPRWSMFTPQHFDDNAGALQRRIKIYNTENDDVSPLEDYDPAKPASTCHKGDLPTILESYTSPSAISQEVHMGILAERYEGAKFTEQYGWVDSVIWHFNNTATLRLRVTEDPRSNYCDRLLGDVTILQVSTLRSLKQPVRLYIISHKRIPEREGKKRVYYVKY